MTTLMSHICHKAYKQTVRTPRGQETSEISIILGGHRRPALLKLTPQNTNKCPLEKKLILYNGRPCMFQSVFLVIQNFKLDLNRSGTLTHSAYPQPLINIKS